MNCTECQQSIVAYLENVLPEAEKQQVATHLQSCPTCGREAAESARLRERLLADGKAPGGSLLDTCVMDRILRETTSDLRRKTMRRRYSLIGLGIAAAAALAVIFLWPSGSGNGTAWANVVSSFQQARTVQFTIARIRGGTVVEKGTVFFKEPNSYRTEMDGRIYIGNVTAGGTVLVLIPAKKQVVMRPSPGDEPEPQNVYEEILKFMSEGAEPMGVESLDGRDAMVFRNPRRNAKVWADPQSHLPIRIEMAFWKEDADYAQPRKIGTNVITDFVFDAPLDDSLFNMTPPAGYRPAPVSEAPLVAVTTTMHAMRKFALPLLKYADKHKEFPASLSDLQEYGIKPTDLVNPARPEQNPGYVYLRPGNPQDPRLIVVYEAYETWDRGINVLYLDGHSELIRDESRFLEQLELTKNRNAAASPK